MPLFFISCAAMNWTGEHCAFIVQTFIKTNEFVTATQRAFHLHFNLDGHHPEPARTWSCYESSTSELLEMHWSENQPADLAQQNSRRCDNFRERLRQCVDKNRSHLNDLIFKHRETEWHYMYFASKKNIFSFLYFICILLNLRMYHIILLHPVLRWKKYLTSF